MRLCALERLHITSTWDKLNGMVGDLVMRLSLPLFPHTVPNGDDLIVTNNQRIPVVGKTKTIPQLSTTQFKLRIGRSILSQHQILSWFEKLNDKLRLQ